MAFNLTKLTELAKPQSEKAKELARQRKENRAWMRVSQDVALCLHYYLRTAGLTQKEFAEQLGVSPVYVGKLLKGGENLTLETICKLQTVLGRNIIQVARPYATTFTVTINRATIISSDAAYSPTYSVRSSINNTYIPIESTAA